jgi:hypothetical protein
VITVTRRAHEIQRHAHLIPICNEHIKSTVPLLTLVLANSLFAGRPGVELFVENVIIKVGGIGSRCQGGVVVHKGSE